MVDGVGNRTEYVLDKWGRITEIKQADGSSECYGYDYAGNITSSTDGEGNTTTYTYNGINKLAAITDPMGQQESYAYDEEERLCRKEDRNGTVPSTVTTCMETFSPAKQENQRKQRNFLRCTNTPKRAC